jgi:hypothetical protein
MAVYNKFQQFVEDLAEKHHNLGSDQLEIALTTQANIPVATNSYLVNLTQIAYTNLSARTITTSASAHTTGTYKLTLTDLVLTASGAVATFRHSAMFNQTQTTPTADGLIAWWDYGADVTLANLETFTLDFDAANGVLQIA